jgi:hypothetical protein
MTSLDNTETTSLPECDFRASTSHRSVYYCRHEKVHTEGNTVTVEICRNCSVRLLDCKHPRPLQFLEQKEPPPLSQQAWNLAKSLASFIADGLTTVTQEQYLARLKICDTCSERRKNKCLRCGCRLSLKARGRAFDCPLKKWPAIELVST